MRAKKEKEEKCERAHTLVEASLEDGVLELRAKELDVPHLVGG